MDLSQIGYTVENVENIVNEFYATSQLTNEFKPQLDQWLKQAQNSAEAWQFSWQLIDMSKSINCQFYGASCLYNKVAKYLNDVPGDQYDLLKNKLLEKLLLYASSLVDTSRDPQLRLIQRKLNSTLAKLALYLIVDQWPTCVLDIIQTIPNCIVNREQSSGGDSRSQDEIQEQQNQLILIVLDILSLLPDEYQSLSNLTKLKRTQINTQMKKNFHLISQYLLNLFNTFNSASDLNEKKRSHLSMIELSIKCLTNWIEFGVQFNEIQLFIDHLFAYIYNENFFEKAAECLTCILNSEENSKYTNSIFKFTPKILEFKNLLIRFVQGKDNDGCVVLTKLILAFGENQLNTIIEGILYEHNENKKLILQLIELIIALSSIPGHFPVDEESSDLTFVFWYTLQDTLLGIDTNSTELQVLFRPFFINLLEIFVVKLQLPVNYDEWLDEEKERLRCYRIDIGDTMVYMISLVGDVMLEFIIKKLMSALETQENNWQTHESLIYMLQSIASELNESYNPEFSSINDGYLISFVNLLPKIKYVNKHILSTTLLAIGSLGNWLERNQNVLPNAISLCLLGLRTDSVAQSASFALKDIVTECDLSAYADDIIKSCQESLRSNHVAAAYEVRLISIIGMCLSDLMLVYYQRSLNWMQTLLEPYLIRLNELAQLKQTDKLTLQQTCHILNLLSQFMSSLIQRQQTHFSSSGGDDSTHQNASASFINTSLNASQTSSSNANNNELAIAFSILVKLLPIYRVILDRNAPNDNVIIDKLFESISVVLSSSIASSSSVQQQVLSQNETLEYVLNELAQMFFSLNEIAWRKYAYEVCRQIIILCWKNDKYKPMLESLFLYSNQNAMKLMSKDMNWFHENTDVVEIYCSCLAKLLKSKFYDLFDKLNQEALSNLLRFAQLGLQLPEQYTLRAVATFVEEFVKYTKLKNNLIEFLEHNAFHLLNVIIIGVGGGLPRHLVDILSGILYVFVKEYPQMTNTVMNQILIKNDFQPFFQPAAKAPPSQTSSSSSSEPQLISSVLSKEQKAVFLKSLLTEANNKRKLKECINEFSLTCRGLSNTQYAKETTVRY